MLHTSSVVVPSALITEPGVTTLAIPITSLSCTDLTANSQFCPPSSVLKSTTSCLISRRASLTLDNDVSTPIRAISFPPLPIEIYPYYLTQNRKRYTEVTLKC